MLESFQGQRFFFMVSFAQLQLFVQAKWDIVTRDHLGQRVLARPTLTDFEFNRYQTNFLLALTHYFVSSTLALSNLNRIASPLVYLRFTDSASLTSQRVDEPRNRVSRPSWPLQPSPMA
jgi:hypothetical protein